MPLKFLSNIYDPTMPDARSMVTRMHDETQAEAWQRKLAWLADKVISEPQPTKWYSQSELKAMHMVGVYERIMT